MNAKKILAPLRPRLEQFVNPQVGLVAVLALFLGIINTLFQVWQIAERTKPQILQLEQILFIPDKYPSGYVFLRIATRVAYVNTGPPNKSSVITKETVRYKIGKKSLIQEWQSFDEFTGKGCAMLPKESRDVNPIVLTGENAVSHVTYFAPRSSQGSNRYSNFYTWQKFIEDIRNTKKIDLLLTAYVLNGRSLKQHCTIEVSSDDIRYISSGCAVTLPCNS